MSGADAALVLRADVEDNADPVRLARIPDATRTRLSAKYVTARTQLAERR